MKQVFKYYSLLFLVALSMCFASGAVANNDATQDYKTQKLNTRRTQFVSKEWKNAANGLVYQKEKKKEPKKKKNEVTRTPNTPSVNPPAFSLKDFSQAVLIFFAIVVLAFVVFRAIAGDAILVNKQIERNKPVTLEEIETNLERADVESFLDKALKGKDYRLAVRLYYLAIIKKLSLAGAIKWKKDKTNGHYTKEMRRAGHPQLKEFRNVTRIFEYVWYSDAQFDGGKFEEVRTDFKNLLAALK